ncbi:hypothetical protein N0V91_009077 [Didymella pomorum]|uniref:C2H2-type domain-containing protein n=1 Tax=Didymella pomorum TaxID=749634 RepID=A0A9W9D3C6_9PLEO|nr:hypothetical protein N0V91_009077 [Didymella pomorum]
MRKLIQKAATDLKQKQQSNERHQATVHGMGSPEFPCTIPHCSRVGNKGFTRKDHLMEHLRNFHKIDVPKRKAGERSAFPFGWPEGMGGEGGRGKSE